MGWLEICCLLAIVIYTVFLAANMIAARRAKDDFNPAFRPTTKITVIIPARNEEKHIGACLESLSQQYYPPDLLEVIVVNDHSSDDTVEKARGALTKHFKQFSLVELEEHEHGKKTAIQKSVALSTGGIIVTRDADTLCDQASWLKKVAFEFETRPCDLLIMPVTMIGRNTFSSAFQKFENLAIMALGHGMASNRLPIVCSGANLAYRKAFFLDLEPYRNNMHISSGDDMFLLMAALKTKAIIHTSNDPVQTWTEPSFKTALHQRLRWASKGLKILTLPIFLSGLTLFLGNLATLTALLCLLIDASYLRFGLFTLTIKLIIDFLLLFLSARMFKIRFNPAWYIPAFVFNLAYTPVITTLSFFVKPRWKGRN